ncbi:hypothetical protein [Halalkalibacter hemicellulosilyticus]|uniref:Uncharacterized protein n=1 Tax=Halalkalibacter hemicellulosilyticusJCM 9152 TaxID=1236971 RepID=W4QLI3_9BACI|nr:hypothetical protein [Halalkalibacter hemicellulosilyticus]GAE32493.1 hypothetical protein JCM9152_4028 [Halalkalibacter hemicellulosilyticusJCM 9152]
MRVKFDQHFKSAIDDVKDILINHNFNDDESEVYAKLIVEVEVAFYVSTQLLPSDNKQRSQLEYLYSGTHLPQFQQFTPTQMELWMKVRVLLPAWKARTIASSKIEDYIEIPVPSNLCHLTFEENTIEWKSLIQYPERTNLYKDLLSMPIPYLENKKGFASPKSEVSYFDKELFKSEYYTIPEHMKPFPTFNEGVFLTPSKKGKDMTISKSDLLQSAERMDMIINQDWYERIKELNFHEVVGETLIKSERLNISGTQHWVGTLSAGKSTIMDVIAFHQSLQEKVTVLVVGDVATALQKVDLFHSLGVKTVPILSYRQRKDHIKQHFQSINENVKSLSTLKKRSFRYLSDTCIIKTSQEKLTDTAPPCFSLKEKGKTKVCPYFKQCSYHNAYLDLPNAQIIVATIQGLVLSELPPILVGIRMRMLEYVSKSSDLILVDESDRVQSQLDSIFAPSVEMAGTEDSWLEKLQNKAFQSFVRSKIPLSKRRVERWFIALQNTVTASYIAFGQLQDQDILKMIGKQYFTGYKLIKMFLLNAFGVTPENEEKIIKSKEFQKLSEQLESFIHSYRKDEYAHEPNNASNEELKRKLRGGIDSITQDNDDIRFLLDEIISIIQPIAKFPDHKQSLLQKQLRFSLSILFIEKNLFTLIQLLPSVRDELKGLVEDEVMSIFTGTPEDYDGLIPISPTGIWMGFRYESDQQSNAQNGKLNFMRYVGVGRYILTNLDHLFEGIDHYKGAPVALLSGTSSAPYSSKYNVQLPVSYLLEKEDEDLPNINMSFRPLMKRDEFIIISGKHGAERNIALKEATRILFQQNILQDSLKRSSSGRERVLIVVGSYKEAKIVGEYLMDIWPDPNEVYHLVNDETKLGTKGEWTRQKISSFPKVRGSILVVPLLALERGHNIITTIDEQVVAAFETAIFLVRPYPKPFDVDRVVNRLNEFSIDMLSKQYNGNYDVKEEVLSLRNRAYVIQKELLANQVWFRHLDEKERYHLVMDMFISVWQLIGRLIRGGVSANVLLCDGSFAPETIKGNSDSYETSMILSWKKVLSEVLDTPKTSTIASKLYSPIINGIQNVEGVTTYEKKKL